MSLAGHPSPRDTPAIREERLLAVFGMLLLLFAFEGA